MARTLAAYLYELWGDSEQAISTAAFLEDEEPQGEEHLTTIMRGWDMTDEQVAGALAHLKSNRI